MEKDIYKPRKDIILDNFLGGIAWGLGITLGAALILTSITIILRSLDVVPVIGNFAVQINHYIQTHPGQ
ncbi:MAG TPA: DUF5665 domain-containing protein [Candidatus Saccharimonadales bacterium]|nr:DUF5665 domain-containing protein [Candidatus Saccharimonadales bacterium]